MYPVTFHQARTQDFSMGGARPANWAPHAEGPPVKKKIRYGLRGYISVGWKLQLLSMHGETIISVPV